MSVSPHIMQLALMTWYEACNYSATRNCPSDKTHALNIHERVGKRVKWIVVYFSCHRFANGAVYDGQWANGKKNGKGTFTYPDGSHYEGIMNVYLLLILCASLCNYLSAG